MNCDSVRNMLDAYTADALTGPFRAEVESHLVACASCRARLAQTRTLVELLRSIAVPDLPDGLAERLARTAAAAAGRRRRRMTAFAVAATLVVGVATSIVARSLLAPAQEPGDEVLLTVGEMRLVALDVATPRALDGVRFVVVLPDGVELAGHEGRDHVSWSGALKPGVNRLNLRLRARRGGAGPLVAEIRHGEQEKVYRVRLRAAPTTPEGANGDVRGVDPARPGLA